MTERHDLSSDLSGSRIAYDTRWDQAWDFRSLGNSQEDETPSSNADMWLQIFVVLFVVRLIYWIRNRKNNEKLEMKDAWWGPGSKPRSQEDDSIRPFKVETSEEEIKDLHQRIDMTRYTPPLEDSGFQYGFNSNYLKKVVSYWRNQFDWKKQVEILNQYPHFKTKIEGIDIHFIHVKPTKPPAGHKVKPLLMIHGWPGSFYEFYKIIPLLTDPESHGMNYNQVFEVICPSIPGYGFSEAPYKQGFNTVAAAQIFCKLMSRLGFQEFFVQGGDWGSLICTNIAQMAPLKFPLDDLLTNVMIYWVTGNIIPSQRFYKENMGRGIGVEKHSKMQVFVPAGLSTFPYELLHCPESWARKKFPSLCSYTHMSRGGHFAAFEEPLLLAEDIQKFMGAIKGK
ncbi:epoxide hydrolase 1-like isoform X3 [Trichosurus vulpecula]|uniref:epoxide hydrolase 1-like isoform X3 n=1 Tax=Trichosurus vulpecula TaxID=9337 RepID=UPI00186B0E80|nr:epoxide hydrolase 1-like isoform X3 [Trichosurus vulpecula]